MYVSITEAAKDRRRANIISMGKNQKFFLEAQEQDRDTPSCHLPPTQH